MDIAEEAATTVELSRLSANSSLEAEVEIVNNPHENQDEIIKHSNSSSQRPPLAPFQRSIDSLSPLATPTRAHHGGADAYDQVTEDEEEGEGDYDEGDEHLFEDEEEEEEGGEDEPEDEHLVQLLTRASDVIREEREKNAQLQSEKDAMERSFVALLNVLLLTGRPRGALPDDVIQHVQRNGLDWAEQLQLPASSELGTLLLHSSGVKGGGAGGLRTGKSPSLGSSCKSSELAAPSVMSERHPNHLTVTPRHSQRGTPRGTRQPCGFVALPRQMTNSGSATDAQAVAMANRLRRALAPQPTEAQVGDVIDSMVKALLRDVRDARSSGSGGSSNYFHLERLRPCTYRFTWGTEHGVRARLVEKSSTGSSGKNHKMHMAVVPHKGLISYVSQRSADSHRDPLAMMGSPGCQEKVIHFTIDSGNLSVRSGGGNVNFLEYLARRRLL